MHSSRCTHTSLWALTSKTSEHCWTGGICFISSVFEVLYNLGSQNEILCSSSVLTISKITVLVYFVSCSINLGWDLTLETNPCEGDHYWLIPSLFLKTHFLPIPKSLTSFIFGEVLTNGLHQSLGSHHPQGFSHVLRNIQNFPSTHIIENVFLYITTSFFSVLLFYDIVP